MLEVLLDTLTQALTVESLIEIIIGWEHNGRGCVEFEIRAVPNSILSERCLTKVEDFLRSATALDRERGGCE